MEHKQWPLAFDFSYWIRHPLMLLPVTAFNVSRRPRVVIEKAIFKAILLAKWVACHVRGGHTIVSKVKTNPNNKIIVRLCGCTQCTLAWIEDPFSKKTGPKQIHGL